MAQPPDLPEHSAPDHTAMAPGVDPEATRMTQSPAGAPPSDAVAAPTPSVAGSSVPGASSVSGVEAGGMRGTPAPIGPGTLLSHTYLVEGLIARGGMGEVHRAQHVDMKTLHAVKVIRPELAQDAKMVELLRREATALRDIRHEAVVSYDGVFRDEYGRLLLSMEFLDGPSLHEIIQAGPLDPESVAVLLDRIASGLAAAHQRGIIHRDMSTDNVILPGRRIDSAKIIDFGIAKQTATGAGTVIGDAFAGKYGYASPEQFGLFGGQIGPQSDIYSAGLVLAAAALGTPLDMGRTPQAMIERRMSVPDLAALAEPLRGVLCSMLEPDPANRVKTMAELVGALTSRAAEITPFDVTSFPTSGPTTTGPTPPEGGRASPGSSSEPSGVATPPEPAKKAPVGLIAAIGAGVVAAGVAGFLLLGQSAPPSPTPVMTDTAKTSAPSNAAETPAPAKATTPVAPPEPPKSVSAAPQSSAPSSTAAPASMPLSKAPEPVTAAALPPPVTSPPVQSPSAPPVPAVIPAAVPVAPPAPVLAPSALAEVRKAVGAAAAAMSCAGVRTVEDGGNRLRVTGYVGTDDDARTLRTLVSSLPPGVQVDARVAVRPWPLCEAMGVAGLPERAETAGGRGVSLSFNRPSMVYRNGDKLEVTVDPGAAGGYLTVDYIDMEGNAIHMVPMRLRPDDRVEPGRPVTLGIARTPSDRVYTISPPYGPAMILAMVTREPLFPADRAEVEPAAAYLPALRAALARSDAGGGVVAQSAFFNTVAE